MSPKLFLSCMLAATLPTISGAVLRGQSPDSGTQSVPQVAPLPNYSESASGQPKYAPRQQNAPHSTGPQGTLKPDFDPNFGSPATDKPHAGTPLQNGDTIPNPGVQDQPSPGTPQWYKETPQAYDHAPQRHRPRAVKPQGQLSLKGDAQPSQEIAAAPQEPMPQEQAPPSYAQPAPRYYAPQQQQ